MNLNRIKIIAIIVGLLLLIPLFGSFFSDGWNWGIEDFVIAFIVLFCAGIAIDFAIHWLADFFLLRILAVTAILTVLILIWVELATNGISDAIQLLF